MEEQDRASIWSVRRDDLTLYSILFPVLWVAGMVAHATLVIEWEDGIVPGLVASMPAVGIVGISAAVLSLMVIAARRFILVLFDWTTKAERRIRKEREETIRLIQDFLDTREMSDETREIIEEIRDMIRRRENGRDS